MAVNYLLQKLKNQLNGLRAASAQLEGQAARRQMSNTAATAAGTMNGLDFSPAFRCVEPYFCQQK